MKNKILKSLFLFIIFILILLTHFEATPSNIYFEDDNFYKAIIDELNRSNINGINNRDYKYIVNNEELENIKKLKIGEDYINYKGISSIKGIEKLKALEELEINYISIPSIDISRNTELKKITIKNIGLLNDINISGCKKLREIFISGGTIEKIDLSENPELENVSITEGILKEIILPKNSKITVLSLYKNKIEKIEDIVNFETANKLDVLFINDNYIQDFSQVDNNSEIGIKKTSPQKDPETEKRYEETPYDKKLEIYGIIYRNYSFIRIVGLSVELFLITKIIIKQIKKRIEKGKNLYVGKDEDLSGTDEDKIL